MELMSRVFVHLWLALSILTFVSSNDVIPEGSSVVGIASLNNSPLCTFEFIVTKCEPFKTFRHCVNRECVCPENYHHPLMPNSFTISTYWDAGRRQCVTKLGSACFITPPAILVGQPFRCVMPNSMCAPAPGAPKGIGICTCARGFGMNSRGECESRGGLGAIFQTISKSTQVLTLQGRPQPRQRCTSNFQCLHVQECVEGQCMCPGNGIGIQYNYLSSKMIWDEDQEQCVSLPGSYCHVNQYSSFSQDDVVGDRLAMSSLGIRCAPGLKCVEEVGGLGGLGVCSGSSRIISNLWNVKLFIIVGFVALKIGNIF